MISSALDEKNTTDNNMILNIQIANLPIRYLSRVVVVEVSECKFIFPDVMKAEQFLSVYPTFLRGLWPF